MAEIAGPEEHQLTGQRAVVTGASSGIGLAIARALSNAGAAVTALSRTDIGPRDREGFKGNTPTFIRADVRDSADLEAARDRFAATGPRLDVLVVNAGVNVRKPFLAYDEEEIRLVLDTNLYGAILTLRAFGELVTVRPGGRVVIVSSVAAIHGYVSRGPYVASKGGLAALTRSLALEWGPFGTTVNAVGPGLIRTSLTDKYMQEHPEKLKAGLEHTPIGRIGEPEDVASVVMFFASPSAGFVTGQLLLVDGGLTAGSSWW